MFQIRILDIKKNPGQIHFQTKKNLIETIRLTFLQFLSIINTTFLPTSNEITQLVQLQNQSFEQFVNLVFLLLKYQTDLVLSRSGIMEKKKRKKSQTSFCYNWISSPIGCCIEH